MVKERHYPGAVGKYAVTKGEQPTGTDAEVCAYLNTASLTVPMDNDWSQIYLYVAGKTYSRWQQKSEMPDDIRVESLTDQQMAVS